MASDFRLPPALATPPSTGPVAKPQDTAAVALKLLRPIDALLLPPGQTSRAEVVSSSSNGGQFNLILRMSQQNTNQSGPRAEIAATSPRAIASGTQVLIQAISQTQLMAIMQPADKAPAGPAATLTRLDPAQFPPGTTVQARVISQQPIDQTRFAVLAKVLQGANSGMNLSLTTNKPLEPGSLLTARVGSQGELRVPDPGRQVLQQALSQGLRETLQRQGSAEPLLNRLQQLATAVTASTAGQSTPTNAAQGAQSSSLATASTTPGTPLQTSASVEKLAAQVQSAVRQVLQQVATPAQLMTPSGVEQAVQRSGLFLEPNLTQLADLLKGGQAPAGGREAAPAGTAPLPQPALAKLLSALAALPVTPGAPTLPGADLKAALINLLVNVQQQLPPAALTALALPPGPWAQGMGPQRGGFPLPPRAMQALADTPDLGSLLRLTAALLSRIQHHQLQSLGQSQTFTDGSTQTTWQLEIPLRDGQQFNHVQVRIQRDDEAPSKKAGEQTPFWEVRLAFTLDHLGALQAIAKLYKGRVNTQFWAEQPHTLSLLNSELALLRDRLLAKGLEVGEISCHQGTPPQPNQALQQRWIDEVT
ncbi:flagellar hook-length control protein FliK [uncultured Halopseudomonas sp.]|uniref:flagellar hook-length control protein FliK n=1 Tax=uncultured Halopseudomonas sp. TaxID=2901193 RepID=UPI0030EC0759|tara:strand:- start:1792 stop:3564 length:1773 start_codon:yes stop_codon:yes gene_type:complete